jgi:transcriptional regulator with GAF, ATPase, and Fis domain/tetratricopeptide (TPR) repeat protein
LSGLAHLGEVHFKKGEGALEAGDLARARELFEKALSCYEDGSAEAGATRTALGSVLAEQGEAHEARRTLELAVKVLDPLPDRGALARALNQLGLVVKDMGEPEVARAHHERAYAVAAETEDRKQRAVALRNLASLDRESGDHARAVQRLVESAELQAAEGDRRGVALVWRQIRGIHLQRGDLRRAFDAVKSEIQSREAALPSGPERAAELPALAAAVQEAGDLARRAGEHEAGERLLSRAVELRHQQHDMAGAGRALVTLGQLLLAAARPRAARAKLEAARDALGEPRGVEAADQTAVRAELWRGFAETDLVRLDAFDLPPGEAVVEPELDQDTATDDSREDPVQLRKRARGEAEEAASLADRAGSPALRAAAQRTLARALAADDDVPGARERFRAALEASEEASASRAKGDPGDAQTLVETCVAYGRFLVGKNVKTAVEYLERAVTLSEEAREKGGVPADTAAQARIELADALGAANEGTRAQVELAKARATLGRAASEEPRTRTQLRVRLDRLERRLAAPATPAVGAAAVLRAAESQATADLLSRTDDAEVRAEIIDNRRLMAIARQLAAETDLERQLPFIVDAAIEISGAERGFLILTGSSAGDPIAHDEVAFKSARNLERTEIERPDRKVSSTIAREALASGAPVVTKDAQSDQRFAGAGSVAEQRLRSVAAVPLRVRGKVTGVLYVDHRYKAGLFTPRMIRALEAVADHASIALETTRLLHEVKQKSDELARDREKLASRVESQTLEIQDIRAKLRESRAELAFKYDYSRIVGRSRRMKEVFRLLDKVIPSTVPVFVHGESGTGKELVARAIHWNGPRRDGPFVSENFSALSDTLLESELFGHVKGSFTGAIEDKKGLFEQAHGGTIFLDEIGDLSEKMQKDLLRVLEEREVRPIGGQKSIAVDVRVVSATHRDLKAMVGEGTFRQDLYYRLNVFSLVLPSLRERKEDIPVLAERFLEEVAADAAVPPKRLDPAALKKLLAYDWPGNVRELKNLLERTALLAKGDVIRPEEIELDTQSASRADDASADATKTWNDAKESFARRYLKDVLARANGNISLAARESGMLRQAFQRLLKRHGVDPGSYRD